MLAPGSLLLPRALAERWPAVLARAGVDVTRTGRKAVLGALDEALVVYIDETADGSVCSLDLVTDMTWRRRLEAIFLSSGASMEDPADITPVVRALYRVGEEQWDALQNCWLREGATLDGSGPWRSTAHEFPSGQLHAHGARLAIETGPALAPDGGPARYVDVLPRFGLRPGRALLALIETTHRQLLQTGAVLVHGLSPQ